MISATKHLTTVTVWQKSARRLGRADRRPRTYEGLIIPIVAWTRGDCNQNGDEGMSTDYADPQI